jgi:predicted lactoylglutathione lyase
MIGYVTLGTNDLARGAGFYDALAAEMGLRRTMEDPRFVAWGSGPEAPMLGLIKPHDGKAATPGNGTMVALPARDRAQVDRLHALALSLGGADEGAPGERFPGFYAAYFRDLDGNKLAASVMGSAA